MRAAGDAGTVRTRYDVAIVGYGPVGQALAILLAQRGWQVGVFERQPAAYPLPRAVHFDHEVARVLQAAGVGEQLAGLTEPADTYEWRNAAGAVLLRFESAAMAVSGWPDANMFSQPELERVLDERARTLPTLDVLRSHEVTGLAQDDDGVTLEVKTSGGAQRVTARFAVGCDGANSFVRSAVGAPVTDLGFFFDWLIVDVLPRAPSVWRPLNVQICDPERPTTLVSGGPGRRRWEFMCLPGESRDDLDNEATAWRLLAPWDVTPESARLERHAVYRFQARWVDVWRRGRVLLAGDAAHQMPPFAGQGMCSGLRDAINVAWKLDLVLAAKASEALLDTYASERIPHVRRTIDFSMALGKVICVADPAEAAARDAAMTAARARGERHEPVPSPGIGPGVVHPESPAAGTLFVQGRVQHRGVTGRFDDVVGRGWTLLSPSVEPATQLDADARAVFASIGGITAHVGPEAPVRDLDGVYTRWFETTRAGLVLQRPDFYVFGTAAAPGEASRLVGDLRRLLRLER